MLRNNIANHDIEIDLQNEESYNFDNPNKSAAKGQMSLTNKDSLYQQSIKEKSKQAPIEEDDDEDVDFDDRATDERGLTISSNSRPRR